MTLDVIYPTNKNSLKNDLIGRIDIHFWDIFQYLLNKCDKIKPTKIEANNDRLWKPWDPNNPIENLFGKINNAEGYSILAKLPLAEGTLTHTGEVTITKTGKLVQDNKSWHVVTRNNCTRCISKSSGKRLMI